MAKTVILDELHLVVRVPTGLPVWAANAARRALTDPRFVAELMRAVRRLVRTRPPLSVARFTPAR